MCKVSKHPEEKLNETDKSGFYRERRIGNRFVNLLFVCNGRQSRKFFECPDKVRLVGISVIECNIG